MRNVCLAAVLLAFVLCGCVIVVPADSPAGPDEPALQTAGTGGTEKPDEGSERTQAQRDQEFSRLAAAISEGTLSIRSGASFSVTDRSGETVDYEISDGTLYLDLDHAEDIVLVLPEDESWETVSLTVNGGHIYAEDLLTVDSLKLDIHQGEADLERIQVRDGSSVEVENGSAAICGDPGLALTAACRQGRLSLAVPFAEVDCSYELEISGGNIHLGSRGYHGAFASRTIDNEGDRSMELTCSHGDISVEFER